jgi:hypothetical protein
MRIKGLVVLFSVIAAFGLMASGFGAWQKQLVIRGEISVELENNEEIDFIPEGNQSGESGEGFSAGAQIEGNDSGVSSDSKNSKGSSSEANKESNSTSNDSNTGDGQSNSDSSDSELANLN